MKNYYRVFAIGFILVCLFGANAYTQSWRWGRGAVSSDAIYTANPYAIATDSHGNIYVTGIYAGTYTAGTSHVTSSGGADIYLTKYDPNGNVLWVKSFGSASHPESPTWMTIDGSDNIFLGTTLGDSTIINGTVYRITPGKSGTLIKFDPSGNVAWTVSRGGQINGMVADNAGGVFATGKSDWFAVKVNSAGSVVWSHGNGEYGFVVGTRVGMDAHKNLYIMGAMQSSATFGSTTLATSSLFDIDMLLLKYDTDGNIVWVKKPGAAGTNYDLATEIAVLPNGDFYFVGTLTGKMGFGPDTINSTDITPFIAKYTAAGNPSWEVSFTKMAGSLAIGTLKGVHLCSDGDIYVTGFGGGNFKFGPDTVKGNQTYVGKVGPDGTLRYAKSTAGSGVLNVASIVAMTTDPSDNVVVTGTTIGTTIFGPDNIGDLSVTTAFTAKFLTGTTGVRQVDNGVPAQFRLEQNYPNPFNPSTNLSFTILHPGEVSLRIYNVLGEQVAELVNGLLAPGSYAAQFDGNGLASGVYYARLLSGGTAQVRSMLLMR